MTTFDSGPVQLDPVGVRLRTFNIRIQAIERLYSSITRANAEPGPQGLRGEPGPQGPPGPEGPPGLPPAHRWQGTSLQFAQSNGEWGVAVDLRGPGGEVSYGIGVINQSTNSYMPAGW